MVATLADTGLADTGLTDTGLTDTGLTDTGLTDTGLAGVVVLALPRGGVPVGYEVAAALGAPLDVIGVRKIGAPRQPELAVGAIASGGVTMIDDHLAAQIGVDRSALHEVVARERAELDRRERRYRSGRPAPDVRDRCVVVVDDGIATGSTMAAAVAALRRLGPAEVVAAAPVASRSACAHLGAAADRVVSASTPEPFHAVGLWYQDFTQTSDDEVVELLAAARRS